jgi:hypothetical protein
MLAGARAVRLAFEAKYLGTALYLGSVPLIGGDGFVRARQNIPFVVFSAYAHAWRRVR